MRGDNAMHNIVRIPLETGMAIEKLSIFMALWRRRACAAFWPAWTAEASPAAPMTAPGGPHRDRLRQLRPRLSLCADCRWPGVLRRLRRSASRHVDARGNVSVGVSAGGNVPMAWPSAGDYGDGRGRRSSISCSGHADAARLARLNSRRCRLAEPNSDKCPSGGIGRRSIISPAVGAACVQPAQRTNLPAEGAQPVQNALSGGAKTVFCAR